MPSYDRALWALRKWLDSWPGIGHIAVGMHREGYDLQLTQYDERGWRATFYTTGMEHSPTSATGTACDCQLKGGAMRSTSRLQAHWWHVAGLVFSVAFALAQTPLTAAQSTPPGELAGIRAAAERFLRALDDLDWEAFRASWVSEPTVFFPFADTPDRVIGQVAVETRWRRFFDEARARRAGPPYLHLKPRDLRAERYGDVGLVTFMLDGLSAAGGRQLPTQRRTLVFVREAETWKLAHLHASSAAQP